MEVGFIKTPVSWMGNKTSVLHILYALFPLNYERYIEPFGGSGAVLLGKKKPDKFEVYNDYNHNLVNLFRCMRDRPLAFIKELGFYPLNSRDDFNAIRDFFRQEKFDDKYLDEELQLTKIILPELKSRRSHKSLCQDEKGLRLTQSCNVSKTLAIQLFKRWEVICLSALFSNEPVSTDRASR